jgi:hypothetical protein
MTYASLVQAIQDYVENSETTFVANIPNFIVNSENRLSSAIQMPDFKKTATGALVAGTATLTIPTDFVTPRHLKLTLAGVDYFLLNKDYDYLKEAANTTTNGLPEYYAIKDDSTIVMAPPPAAGYTYELYYSSLAPSIIDVPAGTWLSTNAPSLLLYACLVEAGVFMKAEAELMQYYQGLYNNALELFRRDGEGRGKKDQYRKPDQRVEV